MLNIALDNKKMQASEEDLHFFFRLSQEFSILPNVEMFDKYFSQILSVRNAAMMGARKFKTFAFDGFFQANRLF